MKRRLIIAAAVVLPIIAVVVAGRVFYPDNVAQTAPDGGEKGLRTRVYKVDPETAAAAVAEIIPTLTSWGANWRLAGRSVSDDGSAEIRAEVPVVVFTDDLLVSVKAGGGPQSSIVDVSSRSRVGKSDFGENRRHVAQLLAALDHRFGGSE